MVEEEVVEVLKMDKGNNGDKGKKSMSEALSEQREAIANKLEKIDYKIPVMSGKGGVGKSTIATNLAAALSSRDYDVGLMDCDMHGPSVPKLLNLQGVEPTSSQSMIDPITTDFGLRVVSLDSFLPSEDSPVIWRGPLKMKTIQQFLGDVNWGDLDYLIFDLPPGTGDEPLSIAQLIPDPTGTVIVTTPQEVALQTIRRAVNFAKEVGLPVLGLVENMSGFICPNCGERVDIFKSGGGKDLSEELGIPFLGEVPLDPGIVESGERGKPFVLCEDTKGSDIFSGIVDKLESSVRGENK